MFLVLKTVYLHLRFLFKSDFRISCFINNGEMIFKRLLKKNSVEIFHIIDQIKVLRLPLLSAMFLYNYEDSSLETLCTVEFKERREDKKISQNDNKCIAFILILFRMSVKED